MSRQIDITRKLTKDEREYLAARGQDHLLAANDEYLRTAEAKPQEADANPYVSVTVKDLREEASKRELEVPSGANKDQLVELLQADDAAKAAAADEGADQS